MERQSEILQGNNRFVPGQYVSFGGLSRPVHPYCADLFSDARTGADPRFCGVLANRRNGLLPMAGEAVGASDCHKNVDARQAEPKAH